MRACVRVCVCVCVCACAYVCVLWQAASEDDFAPSVSSSAPATPALGYVWNAPFAISLCCVCSWVCLECTVCHFFVLCLFLGMFGMHCLPFLCAVSVVLHLLTVKILHRRNVSIHWEGSVFSKRL